MSVFVLSAAGFSEIAVFYYEVLTVATMGGAASHHRTSTSVDQSSPEHSANQTPVREKPGEASSSGKQRRKTFGSLAIKGSFDWG